MSDKEKKNKGKNDKGKGKPMRRRSPSKKNNKAKNNDKTMIKSMDYIPPQAFTANEEVIKLFGSKDKYVQWAKIVNSLAAQGPDIRKAIGSISVNGFFSDSASETNKINVKVANETFTGIAVAIVAHAYNHGFRQDCMQVDKPWYPYFAYMFIYNCLLSVAGGDQAEAPKVKIPDFLLEIFAAIAPKSGTQLGAGTLGYSWTLGNPNQSLSDNFFYPSTGAQVGRFNFFIASKSLEEGYNLMVAPSYPTYTVNAGGEAFSALVNFMNKRLVGGTGKYQPYQPRDYNLEGTLLERSTSAFASVSMVFGGGLEGGYVSSLASSETAIKHRKFAVFGSDASLDRGFRQHVQTAGDSNWLVNSLMLQQSKFEVSNPNYPVFLPVDFYEFADCLALALCRAFTNAYHSNDFNLSNLQNLGLTHIEYLVILRKILMRNFSATQYGVQSLRFYPPLLGSADDFVAFLCNSCGSSSSNNATVKLPLFMVENLNALRARGVYPSINPRTRKQLDKYPRLYIPVLGIYTASTFDLSRYYYMDSNNNKQALFLPTSSTINLVDCRINDKYVDLDCSPKIASDMEIFNTTMTTLGPFMQQLQMCTGDAGCVPLTVIGDCRIINEIKKEGEKKIKKCKECGGEKDKCDNCLKRKKKGPQVVTYEKQLVATLTQQIPITDIAAIKKAFITPEYKLFTSNKGVGTITTNSTRSYSAIMWVEYEGQAYAASTEGNYTDMEAIRDQWVTNCVKNQFSEDNTIVKQLLKLTEQGKAGLLGSLVGAFGGELISSSMKLAGSFIPY